VWYQNFAFLNFIAKKNFQENAILSEDSMVGFILRFSLSDAQTILLYKILNFDYDPPFTDAFASSFIPLILILQPDLSVSEFLTNSSRSNGLDRTHKINIENLSTIEFKMAAERLEARQCR
jgi:hypothetical protein